MRFSAMISVHSCDILWVPPLFGVHSRYKVDSYSVVAGLQDSASPCPILRNMASVLRFSPLR